MKPKHPRRSRPASPPRGLSYHLPGVAPMPMKSSTSEPGVLRGRCVLGRGASRRTSAEHPGRRPCGAPSPAPSIAASKACTTSGRSPRPRRPRSPAPGRPKRGASSAGRQPGAVRPDRPAVEADHPRHRSPTPPAGS
jgi:hypothetical protein